MTRLRDGRRRGRRSGRRGWRWGRRRRWRTSSTAGRTLHHLAVAADLVIGVADDDVAAGAAGEPVGTRPAEEAITAGSSDETVVPCAAVEAVASTEAEELVVSGLAVDPVGGGGSLEYVVPRRPRDRLGRRRRGYRQDDGEADRA
jgi:hypothetical protein